jgi:hypothetical protein
MFRTKLYNKSKHTFPVKYIFSENRAVCEIMLKILQSQADRRWQYGAWAFHAGYLKQQTHAQYT